MGDSDKKSGSKNKNNVISVVKTRSKSNSVGTLSLLSQDEAQKPTVKTYSDKSNKQIPDIKNISNQAANSNESFSMINGIFSDITDKMDNAFTPRNSISRTPPATTNSKSPLIGNNNNTIVISNKY